jgi:hypothetical protein
MHHANSQMPMHQQRVAADEPSVMKLNLLISAKRTVVNRLSATLKVLPRNTLPSSGEAGACRNGQNSDRARDVRSPKVLQFILLAESPEERDEAEVGGFEQAFSSAPVIVTPPERFVN